MEVNKIRTKIIKDSFVRYFKRFKMVNTSFLLFSESNILQGTLWRLYVSIFLKMFLGSKQQQHYQAIANNPKEEWEGLVPSNLLTGSSKRSHFYDWVDYDRIAFSIELLE